MGAPRHLWSGDWQLESAAAAEELAKRRGQIADPSEETEPEPAAAASGPSLLGRTVAWLRHSRDLRAAMFVALLVLFVAGTAFGVTLLVANGSGGQAATAASEADQWLGIEVAGSPSGVVITHVASGSPAADAGLEPGDLLSQINDQPIGTVDSVGSALSGLQSGAQIEIQFSRGPAIFTTLATLGARPPGYP